MKRHEIGSQGGDGHRCERNARRERCVPLEHQLIRRQRERLSPDTLSGLPVATRRIGITGMPTLNG
jgi:hypothetical protein